MVNIFTNSRYKINRQKIRKQTEEILKQYSFDLKSNLRPDSIALNIIFIGRRKMKKIAVSYKKENTALPVLSFSYLETASPIKTSENEFFNQEKLIGEIFICYPQAVLLAAERERTVDDTILNLVEHGIENILNEFV